MTALLEPKTKEESKGERTRRRIIEAARAMIEELGIAAVSQEVLAKRVGLTQSALRHHFPTKDAMFDAIFDHTFAPFYRSSERILLDPGVAPRETLMRLVRQHLGHVVQASDRVTLESFAHYLGSADLLARQSNWYHWLAGHYVALIGSFRPELNDGDRRARALAIVTLSTGAWITIGRSRPEWPDMPGTMPHDALIQMIEQLIDG